MLSEITKKKGVFYKYHTSNAFYTVGLWWKMRFQVITFLWIFCFQHTQRTDTSRVITGGRYVANCSPVHALPHTNTLFRLCADVVIRLLHLLEYWFNSTADRGNVLVCLVNVEIIFAFYGTLNYVVTFTYLADAFIFKYLALALIVEEIAHHFRKYSNSLSCRELDEKTESSHVCTVNMKLQPAAG